LAKAHNTNIFNKMRYFIDISYLGTNYHGWQVQKNETTVQQKINEALTISFGQPVVCLGSGRTDAGVHATQQIAHFDSEEINDFGRMKLKLNGILPWDISINSIYRVNEDISARFNASSRSYIYKIHQKKNPFLRGASYFFSRKLDLEKMNQACNFFQKHTDFEAFSRVNTDVNNFDCTIFEIGFIRQNESILFQVKANRFLRGMVRAIVGTMLDIGQGKSTINDLDEILKSRNRRKAGSSVPACGLYLNEIVYPENILPNMPK